MLICYVGYCVALCFNTGESLFMLICYVGYCVALCFNTGESLFMLICYVGYCVALCFNTSLEAWVQTWPYIPCKVITEQEHLVTYKTLDSQGQTQNSTNYAGTALSPTADPYSMGAQQPQQQQQQQPQVQQPGQNTHAPGMAPRPEYYKAKEQDPDQVSPLIRPESADLSIQIQWRLCLPVHYMCVKTMPDCRSEQYRNWYPFTFLISMIWISFYSYIMVWMITVIGSTLGIPDTVMGLTFVAAGVSVPDALSSLAVVKEGYGDMAVSNAVGSNVFDILICLGLPWFIQTAMIKPGSHVNVYSKGLTYSTLSLLSTVVFLVFATHANGWKLDKRYGVILMIWYLLFIGFASLYELNVFGFMNPPECPSDY
ncbi:hypothetical protein J6590_051286 [Homalodisca vitripennis]|nr:hypothetical protein J6590_051286 [Homalodisca vitripennis]